MAFVRDATALARTATLERVRHSVKLARGQANANRVKEGDGNQADSSRGLIACSPMTNKPSPDIKKHSQPIAHLQPLISSDYDDSCDLAQLSL